LVALHELQAIIVLTLLIALAMKSIA